MPNLPKNFLLKVVKFNTFILAVSSFLVSIFLPNAALAQSSDEIGHQVSGTDIIIPSTDFKSGDVINGELVLQNKDTRPSNDWIYRASITEDNEGGPGDIINSVLYKDVISIPGNQETKLNFSIPLLTTLPTGTYGLEVELLTASVANPGPFFYKQIKVTGSGAGFLTIKKLALVANDVEEPPTVGLPHKASDTLKARMEIENKNQSAITATPEFKIYIRQSHKEPFQVVSTSETVFPGNSTKTVDLDIPALPEGNSYWGEAIFKTEDQQVAKIAPFRIVISGTSAKIIRVTTDKTEYKKGETVKVLVEYTGPVEDYPTGDLGSGDLQVKIKSGFRQIGSGEATIDLNQAGSAEINIPASASFKNSEIEVTILKDSKVLDQFISKQNGGNNLVDLATSNLVPILGVLGVASVVLVGVLLRKRKKLFWTFLGLVFLSSALFVGGFKVKEVFANHCFITCSQQQTDLSDSRAGHGVNPLVHEWNGPSRDSLWRPGERPNFGGRMLQNGCGNTFGAPGYGLPNRTTFRIQYNTLAWNVRGGDVLGTQTDGSTARSYVGWFWNGWSVPNNIPQKEALLQAEPEGYNLQGSPQHYDRLLLSERVFFGQQDQAH